MDKLNERDRTAYAAIDEALRTYPLKQTPESLLPAVMEHIQARQPKLRQPRKLPPQARFRLAWTDYAISLFAAGMAMLVLLVWQPTWLPQNSAARLELQLLRCWQYIRYAPPTTTNLLLGGLVIANLALVAAASWLLLERQLKATHENAMPPRGSTSRLSPPASISAPGENASHLRL